MSDESQTRSKTLTAKCPHCKTQIILEGVLEIWKAGGGNDYGDWLVECESCGNYFNPTVDTVSTQGTKTQPKNEPSTEKSVPWLYAHREVGSYSQPTGPAGKWLIFVRADAVDDVWRKIKQAVEEGKLGGMAKVSTAMPNRHSSDPSKSVICICTYDANDEADVQRVKLSLREMGFTNIRYKTDAATIEGKYKKFGDKDISRRYE
jgi:hypothetical protein